MSFGYGQGHTTTHNETARAFDGGGIVRARFSNDMVAHVWAQYVQTFGASGNGNFYFKGRTLFSYGPHFAAGYLLPLPGDPTGAGVALVNADDSTPTTGRHVSDAAGAARHRGVFRVPELTRLADTLESVIREASPRLNPGSFPSQYGPPTAAGLREGVAAVRRHLVRHWPGEEAAAAIFAALQADNPERRARAAHKAAKREEHARAMAERGREEAAALRLVKRTAEEVTPASVAARMVADARQHAPAYTSRNDSRVTYWEEQGRDIFRAAKVAKAKGRTAQAAKARAVYQAIRATLPEFEAAAIRHNRRRFWARNVADVRAGFDAMRNRDAMQYTATESTYRGGGGPNRNGPGHFADVMHKAATAAAGLRLYTGHAAPGEEQGNGRGMAAHAIRVAGHNPAELAARLSALQARFMAEHDTARRASQRVTERAELAALKAWRDMAPDAPAERRKTVAGNAHSVAERYAPTTWRPGPLYPIPGAWRVTGWTPEAFAAIRDAAKRHNREAAEELKRIATEEADRAKATALAMWRAGDPIPAELARHTPRARPDGCAYVRAVDVERDAAGAITGGTLETSQGATVPLAHAVRVFRFLKACRDAGQGWRANGRTLRVGYFTVDSVSPDGGFKAGCHAFAWEEVAELAAALGLSDIAGADTTESRAHA